MPKSTSESSKNVYAAIAQGVLGGLILAVLYANIVLELGVQQLGVWVLLVTVTGLAGIGELGFSATLVHFVGRAFMRGKSGECWEFIVAAMLVALAAQSALALMLFFFAHEILKALTGRLELYIGDVEIIFALFFVVTGGIAKILLSAIDAIGKTRWRCVIKIWGSLVLLGVGLLLMPTLQLEGLLIAQCIEALILVVASLYVLVKQFSGEIELWAPPSREKAVRLLALTRPALSIVVVQALVGPIAKSMLSLFGGVSVLGYFELANRLLIQGRAVIVAGHRAVLPNYTIDDESREVNYRQTFLDASRLNLVTTFPIFLGAVAAGPLISLFWLGEFQREFILTWQILCGGWFVSTLALPGFYLGYGRGQLRVNFWSQILILLLLLGTGGLLGLLYGALGVVAAYSGAIALGSLPMITKSAPLGIKISDIVVGKTEFAATCSCVIGSVIGALVYSWLPPGMPDLGKALLPVAVFVSFCGLGYWPLLSNARAKPAGHK